MDKRVPVLWKSIEPRISEQPQYRGQKDKSGTRKADCHLQRQKQEFGDFEFICLCECEHQKIHNDKEHLTHKEVVVYNARRAHRDRKKSPALIKKKRIERRQKQREHYHRFVKMEKEYVIYRKTRECVKYTAHYRKRLVLDIPLQEKIRRTRRAGELQYQYRPDQIRNEFVVKRDRHPEKRTAQRIKAVARDRIAAEVGKVIPSHISAFYLRVKHLVKRDLLNIKISVVIKYAALINNKRYKQRRRND